jgi:hypothetical protein
MLDAELLYYPDIRVMSTTPKDRLQNPNAKATVLLWAYNIGQMNHPKPKQDSEIDTYHGSIRQLSLVGWTRLCDHDSIRRRRTE